MLNHSYSLTAIHQLQQHWLNVTWGMMLTHWTVAENKRFLVHCELCLEQVLFPALISSSSHQLGYAHSWRSWEADDGYVMGWYDQSRRGNRERKESHSVSYLLGFQETCFTACKRSHFQKMQLKAQKRRTKALEWNEQTHINIFWWALQWAKVTERSWGLRTLTDPSLPSLWFS